MKNILGFIKYKIIKKKNDILEALQVIGVCSIAVIPAFLLLFISTETIYFLGGLIWIFGVMCFAMFAESILEIINDFKYEYNEWKEKQP